MRRRWWLAGLAPLVAVAVTAGCSSSQDERAAGLAQQSSGSPRSAAGQVQAQGGPQLPAQATPQQVIYTGDLTVRVRSVPQAVGRAVDLVKGMEGHLFAQSADLEGEREASLTLKVPPARFEDALRDLAALGEPLQRQVTAEDVTAQVVDLEGRLKTAQASADRLRALLGDARSTADLVALESELAKREAEIESMQGRLRVLTAQVDLATIDLRLTEKAEVEVSGDVPGFVDSVRAGGAVLGTIALGVVAVAGFLLPFVPIVIACWLLFRLWRRRHPKKPKAPRLPMWPPGSGPPAAVPQPSPPASP